MSTVRPGAVDLRAGPPFDVGGADGADGRAARDLLACLPDPAFRVAANGTVTFASPAAVHELALDAVRDDPALGRQLVHPDDRTEALVLFQEALAAGAVRRTAARLLGADGNYRTYDVLLAPHPTGARPAPELFVVARDATERLRREADLAEQNAAVVASEERLRGALQSAGMGFLINDFEGNFVEFNEAAAALFGYTREEFARVGFTDLIPPGELESHRQTLRSMLGEATGAIRVERPLLRRDGGRIWVSITSAVIHRPGQAPAHVACCLDDVTGRRAAMAAAVAQRNHSAALLDRVVDAYAFTQDGEIQDVNEAMCSLTGLSRAQLVGQRAPFTFWPAETAEASRAVVKQITDAGGGDIEMQWQHADGSRIDVQLYVRVVDAAGTGGPRGVMTIAHDVTEVRARERELRYRAEHDGLTGLLNKTSFSLAAAAQVDLAGHGARATALAVLDLDDFKQVNDGYGHLAGDAVLVEFAARLRAGARVEDVLGRIGGEEFAWLMPETSLDEALRAVERAAARARDEPIAGVGRITFSAGVSAWTPDPVATGDPAPTVTDLWLQADQALYAAKRAGRDRVRAACTDGLDVAS